MVCVNIMVNVVNVSGVVMMVKLVLVAKMLRLELELECPDMIGSECSVERHLHTETNILSASHHQDNSLSLVLR